MTTDNKDTVGNSLPQCLPHPNENPLVVGTRWPDVRLRDPVRRTATIRCAPGSRGYATCRGVRLMDAMARAWIRVEDEEARATGVPGDRRLWGHRRTRRAPPQTQSCPMHSAATTQQASRLM